MKKLLLFVTMAASLLFTQCKKDDPVSSAGKTVRMTVTAGPGSKTDIADDGAIKWSEGDKLYVGDGSKYIGCLTLIGDGGSATGVFTGNVTLTDEAEVEIEETEVDEPKLDDSGKGDGQTFHFFYLGNAKDYDKDLTSGKSTTVNVDFSSQEIYAKNDNLVNASKYHVGYGSAMGTVVGNVVTDINVMMVSKVAIAHFSFKKGAAYTGALTLKGDNICNKMTVNFNSAEFACEGTKGGISLTNETTSEKYVMLVPTSGTTTSQTLTFVGEDVEGTATLENGILPNKFYGKDDAIAVTLKASTPKFSVAKGNYVEFASGNLYYNGASDASKTNSALPSGWNFYDNQWDCYPSGTSSVTDKMEINLFTWGYGTWSTVYNTNGYETANTMTDWGTAPGLPSAGEGKTWRTLTSDEWGYLINTRTVNDGKGEGKSYQRATVNGVYGMILYPDNYTAQSSSTSYSGDTWTSMESYGVVFLPAAGIRKNSSPSYVGSYGIYWSSTYIDNSSNAYALYFRSSNVNTQDCGNRDYGRSVRLVR